MTETAYYVHIVVVLQPLRWCCVDCAIHHERDVREEQKYIYVARTSNNRVISSGDLYWCLLPRCESLRTCRSGFPIATVALRFPGLTVGYTSASQPVGREIFRDILNIFWKKLLVDTNCIFLEKGMNYESQKCIIVAFLPFLTLDCYCGFHKPKASVVTTCYIRKDAPERFPRFSSFIFCATCW